MNLIELQNRLLSLGAAVHLHPHTTAYSDHSLRKRQRANLNAIILPLGACSFFHEYFWSTYISLVALLSTEWQYVIHILRDHLAILLKVFISRSLNFELNRISYFGKTVLTYISKSFILQILFQLYYSCPCMKYSFEISLTDFKIYQVKNNCVFSVKMCFLILRTLLIQVIEIAWNNYDEFTFSQMFTRVS